MKRKKIFNNCITTVIMADSSAFAMLMFICSTVEVVNIRVRKLRQMGVLSFSRSSAWLFFLSVAVGSGPTLMNLQTRNQLVKASPKADVEAPINTSRCNTVNTLDEINIAWQSNFLIQLIRSVKWLSAEFLHLTHINICYQTGWRVCDQNINTSIYLF